MVDDVKLLGDEAQVELLLKSGIDANSVNEDGEPILQYAAVLSKQFYPIIFY